MFLLRIKGVSLMLPIPLIQRIKKLRSREEKGVAMVKLRQSPVSPFPTLYTPHLIYCLL
jgi:hypothetical protein